MLSVRPKIAEPGLHLFQRSVHPELLEICAVRQFEREHYVLKTEITTAGHCITFHTGDVLLTEVCASMDHELPDHLRLLSRTPDVKQCDEILVGDRVGWHSKFQLESIQPKVFLTIQQQLDEQGECEGLVHRFRPTHPISIGAISYVNFQAFSEFVIVRAFHTFPETLTVARTETRFSILDGDKRQLKAGSGIRPQSG